MAIWKMPSKKAPSRPRSQSQDDQKKKDEGSEDFELVPSIEDVEEPSNEDEQQKSEKEQRAETTLIAFKVMLGNAAENEDILYGQSQALAEILEGLDEKRLE